MKFLCIGYGNAGKRHTGILREMGHRVTTVDPDPDTGSDYHSVESGIMWLHGDQPRTRQIFPVWKYDGILDCTPPDIRAGWQVVANARFVEKPLGDINRSHGASPTMIGFNYFWLPSLREFVESIVSRKIYSLVVLGGQWLPDWNPDRDYRQCYHGGVVLDSLPHSLFVARWILGEMEVAGVVLAKLGGFDIDAEDSAAVLLRSQVGPPCLVLADYLRQPRGFYVGAVTDDGVKYWAFDPAEADQMYRRQMEVFVEICRGEWRDAYPNFQDGIAVQLLLDEILGANGAVWRKPHSCALVQRER